jgi:hypothetical protein
MQTRNSSFFLEAAPMAILAALLPACTSAGNAPGGNEEHIGAGGSGAMVGSGATGGSTAIGTGGATPNGGTSNAGGSGGMPSGGTGAAGSTGGTGTNGTSGAPNGGTGGSGGTSVGDPNTISVKMDEFTVAPGQEVFMCQDFDNPFGGMDVGIGRSESNMTPGSHHLHVYYGANSPATRTVAPCADPFEFRPMIHLATIPNFVSAYPPKMAAVLKGTTGLRMQVHYLNTGTQPIQARVTVRLTKVDPTTVDKWVAQMHFNRTQLAIRPGRGQTLTTSCTIPQNFGPIGLVSGVSHMHKRGVHFVATTGAGKMLLETDDWDEPPPTFYDPPVMLNPGDSIRWTCTYDNDTATTFTFGDSAEKNEMCIYIGRFFSSPNGDDLNCETPYATGTAIASPAPSR